MPPTAGDVEEQAEDRPPPYDPAAVGRVAACIEIRDVELLHAHFERGDDGPLPADRPGPSSVTPDVFLDVEWDIDRDRKLLGYLIRFGVEAEEPAFRVFAFFRLSYQLIASDVEESDLSQFGYWNAVFNGWPYFREYVSSTINRAGLPRLMLPVMRVPRRDA